MNVSVFGLGYVGCVSAACLARTGHHVVGVDVNEEKVAMINGAQAPIVEPSLAEVLAEVVGNGHLSATTDPMDAVRDSDIALICVGTPGVSHGRPDVDALEQVGVQIGRALEGRTRPFTVVLRSTVLPGTTERVLLPALREGAGARATWLRVIVNPEFMREGSSLHDFDHPPLVVVGSRDADAVPLMQELYATVTAPFVQTTVRSAEFVKYASNTFHGLKVCFANELARVADALGADANEVSRVFLMDHKLNVSEAYLKPGFAFGGSCLPKDLRAVLWAARAEEVETPLLSSVMPSNDLVVREAIDAVLATRARKIGVVGLAFKPGTDDLRESPVVTMVEALIGKGCDVRILDRNVMVARLMGANRRYIEKEIPHIGALLCDSVDELVGHAEVLIIGSATDEAAEALRAAGPHCVIHDLTRGAAAAKAARTTPAVETCA